MNDAAMGTGGQGLPHAASGSKQSANTAICVLVK